jgi:uncharacterized repeat protein (TIGR03803 family)
MLNQMKMNRIVLRLAVCISFGIFCLTAQSAVTFTTLFSFSGTNGIEPEGQLVQTSDGTLYGTARDTTFEKRGNANFGFNGRGTIFRITTNGVFSSIINFPRSMTNGAFPRSGLTIGDDGNFYGTTTSGGVEQKGTVFRLTTNGALTTLALFNHTNGESPVASLLKTKDNFLWGTTVQGGEEDAKHLQRVIVFNGYGTIFSLTPNGKLKTVHNFDGLNGANPSSSLVQGNDGCIYGTTIFGGANWLVTHKMTNEFSEHGFGTVFKINTNGEMSTLLAFNGYTGQTPTAIAISSDGSIYGITSRGGAKNTADPNQEYAWQPFKGGGTIFKISSTGEFKTLVLFYGANGLNPSSFCFGKDGSFYGATTGGGANGQGTIFKLTTNGKFTTLYSFKEPGSSFPNTRNSLMQGEDGNLYGTTCRFGENGCGSIFRLKLN